MEQLWVYGSLCAAAVAAGAVNAIAGGGTLITFPTLLFALRSLGPDEAGVIANATSTAALVPGSLAGAWGYRHELRGNGRWLILLAIPSLMGGVVGALLLTGANPAYFKLVIPWLLLIASLLFLAQPYLTRWVQARSGTSSPSHWVQAGVVAFQFLLSVYGGYFGAGAGILMLTSLGFLGIGTIHQMNAIKTVLIATINSVALVIFIANGKIVWPYAAAMAAASILGGYYGAVVGRRLPRWLIRAFVISVGLSMAAYYFLVQAGLISQ